MAVPTLSPEVALRLVIAQQYARPATPAPRPVAQADGDSGLPRATWGLLDVRAESEFAQGHIEGFASQPILMQNERHQVGLTYRHHGQEAAIRLGYELVGPQQEQRVHGWIAALTAQGGQEAVVLCWRGGLRSQIACQWLASAGVTAYQVQGGYKALRQRLLAGFEALPRINILAGATGSGKSHLLGRLACRGHAALDLEKLAAHRGSAFGALPFTAQPSQAKFENDIGLVLWEHRWHQRTQALLVEDESRMIGCLALPHLLFQQMSGAPVIEVRATPEQRIANIYQDYVLAPYLAGMAWTAIEAKLSKELALIARRLDRYAAMIKQSLAKAFASGQCLEAHQSWIEPLLLHYYDPRYAYAQQRSARTLVFAGNALEIEQWLEHEHGVP